MRLPKWAKGGHARNQNDGILRRVWGARGRGRDQRRIAHFPLGGGTTHGSPGRRGGGAFASDGDFDGISMVKFGLRSSHQSVWARLLACGDIETAGQGSGEREYHDGTVGGMYFVEIYTCRI
jgi:hypothetical protein